MENLKINDTVQVPPKHKTVREHLRENYTRIITALLFIVFTILWGYYGSFSIHIDNFEEMLIFMSSFIVPTYFSVVIPSKLFGNKYGLRDVVVTNHETAIPAHNLERNTFVVFVLAPILMTVLEPLGVLIFMGYYVVTAATMLKQTDAERTTAIVRILALISLWLTLVWGILNIPQLGTINL